MCENHQESLASLHLRTASISWIDHVYIPVAVEHNMPTLTLFSGMGSGRVGSESRLTNRITGEKLVTKSFDKFLGFWNFLIFSELLLIHNLSDVMTHVYTNSHRQICGIIDNIIWLMEDVV